MCVGEEGVSIVEFNPDPYIQKWYEDKFCRINGAKSRNYPSKCWSVASSNSHIVVDIAWVTLSDLESSEDEFTEFWMCHCLYIGNINQYFKLCLVLELGRDTRIAKPIRKIFSSNISLLAEWYIKKEFHPFFLSLWFSVTNSSEINAGLEKNHISIWIFIINLMKQVSLSTHLKVVFYMKCWIPPTSCIFQLTQRWCAPTRRTNVYCDWFSRQLHSGHCQIDQLHSVCQALGVNMWKQSWLKCFNLNIPLFLIQTNFMEEIKKTL